MFNNFLPVQFLQMNQFLFQLQQSLVDGQWQLIGFPKNNEIIIHNYIISFYYEVSVSFYQYN